MNAKTSSIIKFDKSIREILLLDMTQSADEKGEFKPNKQNIIWATSGYEHEETEQIEIEDITEENSNVIRPRVEKDKDSQISRTKDHAEVFTPTCIVKKQIDLCDEDRPKNPKQFADIEKYLKKTYLEITCGEAPYIANRYDVTTTAQLIDCDKRVGFLDRKLQVLNGVDVDEKDWIGHAKTALKACYGFDYQGDNVLLARVNIFETVGDFYYEKFKKDLTNQEVLQEFAEIIVYNIWQMDGLNYNIPSSDIKAKIMDWEKEEPEPIEFAKIVADGELINRTRQKIDGVEMAQGDLF